MSASAVLPSSAAKMSNFVSSDNFASSSSRALTHDVRSLLKLFPLRLFVLSTTLVGRADTVATSPNSAPLTAESDTGREDLSARSRNDGVGADLPGSEEHTESRRVGHGHPQRGRPCASASWYMRHGCVVRHQDRGGRGRLLLRRVPPPRLRSRCGRLEAARLRLVAPEATHRASHDAVLHLCY